MACELRARAREERGEFGFGHFARSHRELTMADSTESAHVVFNRHIVWRGPENQPPRLPPPPRRVRRPIHPNPPKNTRAPTETHTPPPAPPPAPPPPTPARPPRPPRPA